MVADGDARDGAGAGWRLFPAWGRLGPVPWPPAAVASSLEMERARWFVWLPVLFGLGISIYFWLPFEPGLAFALAAPAVALSLRASWTGGLAATLVTGVLLAASAGFLSAKVRTEWARAPVLERRTGPVEVRGYAELVEPRAGRGQRITLRVTGLGDRAPGALPKRARIRTLKALEGLKPGDSVRVKARLAPPPPPALPGDYDFARAAWFSGLGAVGYATTRPEILVEDGRAPWTQRLAAAIERVRQGVGRRVVAAVPGEAGAIANALLTGERGGISPATTDAFRNSGLLHMLSISGLHMVVMAGTVFVAVRVLLAAVPVLALRTPTKKLAAAAASIAALAYLLLSGSSVPTVRAFIMISIMFLAVMVDRPALAMRNVAIAALLILSLVPESLLDAGFQMSFAAVVSLVAIYEVVAARRREGSRWGPVGKVALFFGGIVLSTLVASLAVAPFAAYHFHKSQQFAILANLIAIPICNFVVMPAGLVTLVLMPFGLEAAPLSVMARGIDAIVWSAVTVASLPGAVAHIGAIPEIAFGLMTAGGLWLALWRTRWRLLGIAGVAGGLACAPGLERPDVLVGRDGSLVAVRAPGGELEALPARQSGMELKRWLEHDGDERTAPEAATGAGFRCDGAGCTVSIKGALVAVVRHPSAFADDCLRARILIASVPRPPECRAPRVIVDYPAMRARGTHALYIEGPDEIRIETVAESRGERPWSKAERYGFSYLTSPRHGEAGWDGERRGKNDEFRSPSTSGGQ